MLRSQLFWAAPWRILAAGILTAAILAVGSPQASQSAPPDSPSFRRPESKPDTAAPGVLLKSTTHQQQLISQLIEREVEAALRRAAATVSEDPTAVNQELKLLLHQILAAPELTTERQASLRQRLETALRESDRRQADLEARQLERQQARAAAQERARVAGNLAGGQERLKQLMERFDSLLVEGRYDLAESVAAQVASESSSGADVTGTSALVNVDIAGATREALAARIRRQQGVVRALEQVELSGVALPGDEPIVYPQAESWQELTARRAKYARTDLHDSKPAEARLSRALNEMTNFDFVDVSLADAVTYLKDLHGIEIQFDSKALQDESFDVDIPITRRLSGISLRSALRLLLGALDLTYTIDNEVLLITTPDRAAHRLVTKVYPVGELVLPITMPRFGNGFGPPGSFGGQNQNGGNQQGGRNPMNAMGQNQNNNPFGQGIF